MKSAGAQRPTPEQLAQSDSFGASANGGQKRPSGGAAVMASRKEPPDSLDYFPTPPWATRALMEHVHLKWLSKIVPQPRAFLRDYLGTVWEPACGEGHMAAVLEEYAPRVLKSDIFDYGHGDVRDFLAPENERPGVRWIITNPPFNTALDFALKALAIVEDGGGVALLCRNNWIEGADRYERLFRDRPPNLVAPFVERVPMVKGRWDPSASTATGYTWFVWYVGVTYEQPIGSMVMWIPPGCRKALTREGDIARFAAQSAAPLFDEGAA